MWFFYACFFFSVPGVFSFCFCFFLSPFWCGEEGFEGRGKEGEIYITVDNDKTPDPEPLTCLNT